MVPLKVRFVSPPEFLKGDFLRCCEEMGIPANQGNLLMKEEKGEMREKRTTGLKVLNPHLEVIGRQSEFV